MRPATGEQSDRERFLAAVAEHVPLDRVVELYLFQPIRQGGVESGVAVLAAAPAGDPAAVDGPIPDTGVIAEQPPVSEEVLAESRARGAGSEADASESADVAERRYTVFTARYRHVLKGPDRGRWEVSVVAEADAPLATVGAVVRGVQRRAGDVEPPEHLTGDAVREVLGQGPAT